MVERKEDFGPFSGEHTAVRGWRLHPAEPGNQGHSDGLTSDP